MSVEKMTQKINYLVTAYIHKVKIDKKLAFESKVMWKRSEGLFI